MKLIIHNDNKILHVLEVIMLPCAHPV